MDKSITLDYVRNYFNIGGSGFRKDQQIDRGFVAAIA